MELLKSNYVTKGNYEEVYIQLNELVDSVLYSKASFQAEQSKRSVFLSALEGHDWYTLRTKGILKDVYKQSDESSVLLQAGRADRDAKAMRNITQIDEYRFLTIVQRIISDVNKAEPMTQIWLDCASALIQVCCGSRWIETVTVSSYTLPEAPAFSQHLYIVVSGVAKESSKALNRFYKAYQQAEADNTLEELAIIHETDQSLMDEVPDRVIVKPCLFGSYGITPAYIVDLAAKVQEYVESKVPKAKKGKESDVQYRSRVSSALYKKANEYFHSLWSTTERKKFRNTTHTWRKLYASYSYYSFGNGTNQQAWYEDVLGHDSITTSFSYSDVTVRPGIKATDPELSSRVAALESRLQEAMELIKKLQDRRPEIIMAQAESDDRTVMLPGLDGAGDVEVQVFTNLKKRFKPTDQGLAQKQQHFNDSMAVIRSRLAVVDIKRLDDRDWALLGIPREWGRKL
jgi:hypothetical protein